MLTWSKFEELPGGAAAQLRDVVAFGDSLALRTFRATGRPRQSTGCRVSLATSHGLRLGKQGGMVRLAVPMV